MPTTWFIKSEGREFGPFSFERLQQFVSEGRIVAETLLRRADSPQWLRATAIPDLHMPAIPPPEPPRTAIPVPPTPKLVLSSPPIRPLASPAHPKFMRASKAGSWWSTRMFGQKVVLFGLAAAIGGGFLIAVLFGLLALNYDDMASGVESRQVRTLTGAIMGAVCVAVFSVPVCGALGALIYFAIGRRQP